jgi:transcriptional regulator with XRE-family HTH domain
MCSRTFIGVTPVPGKDVRHLAGDDIMTDEADWYGPDVATFGDRVAAAREYSGMTQAVVAKRLGVRVSTMRDWEDDLSEPRANRLSHLAGLLNVSMMWLINGEGTGIIGPDDSPTLSDDLRETLNEMRVLRAEILKNAESMGRLEKRMRRILSETADD